MMGQASNKLKIILIVFLVFLSFPSISDAAGLNFDVQAVIPENQYDRNQTYFDLLVKPGQSQTLTFIVENTSNQSVTVEVFLNPGWTNHNGVVSYADNENQLDESMKYPITSLISESYKKISLKPEEKKKNSFSIK